jgi:hypothetical protein
MNSHSGRLVNNQKILILEENLDCEILRFQVESLWSRLAKFNSVTSADSLLRSGGFTIQPDMPGPNQRLNPGSRQTIDFRYKKKVKPPAGISGRNDEVVTDQFIYTQNSGLCRFSTRLIGGLHEAGKKRPGVGRPHQRLPDERGVGTCANHSPNVIGCFDPALTHDRAARGNLRSQTLRNFQVGFERCQISIIDCEKFSFRVQCPAEFRLVMHLNEAINPNLCRHALEALQLVIL